MSSATFDHILTIIEPSLHRESGSMIDPCKQLLLALWRLATSDSFR